MHSELLCTVLRSRKLFSSLNKGLWAILAVFAAVSSLHAQGKDGKSISAPDVIVDLGKPNIWTMDQAHYLLERNRARDLGLQAVDPSPLDPNDIAGIRLNSIRSLLTGQVQYDQSIGANNKGKMTQYNADLQRYDSLRNQRDGVRLRQQALQSQLANADANLIEAQAVTPADPIRIANASAQVKHINDQKAAADSEYSQLTTEMGSEPSAPVFTTGTPAEESSQSVLGDDANYNNLLKLYATGPGASKIAASVRLDNYVNLQYELVAKQLTLLRDQAGPDNKVLFLELPQSIYVTNKLRLYPYLGGWWGAHVLQTWWRLDEALITEPPPKSEYRGADQRPPTQAELIYMNNEFARFWQIPKDDASQYMVHTYGNSDPKGSLATIEQLKGLIKNYCPSNYFALQSFFEPDGNCGKNFIYLSELGDKADMSAKIDDKDPKETKVREDAKKQIAASPKIKLNFPIASTSVDQSTLRSLLKYVPVSP